jgi:hypothetical protein
MKVQQNGAILLVESKIELKALDQDPKPTQPNLRWHLHDFIVEGNSIGLDQKNLKESSWFGNQEIS